MDTSFIIKLIGEISAIMDVNKERLIELDSVVGDGDLGLTMTKGFKAAYDNASTAGATDAGKLLFGAGKAMSSAAPSTMGTLMAIGLMQGGKALKGKSELEASDIADFLAAYEAGIMEKGKAKLGEKTFLDGFDPGAQALKAAIAAGDDFATATAKAAAAAEEGFNAATDLIAVHGKPAVKGEASRGMIDPGACVASLIFKALENAAK